MEKRDRLLLAGCGWSNTLYLSAMGVFSSTMGAEEDMDMEEEGAQEDVRIISRMIIAMHFDTVNGVTTTAAGSLCKRLSAPSLSHVMCCLLKCPFSVR
jgi:hypothetical protein